MSNVSSYFFSFCSVETYLQFTWIMDQVNTTHNDTDIYTSDAIITQILASLLFLASLYLTSALIVYEYRVLITFAFNYRHAQHFGRRKQLKGMLCFNSLFPLHFFNYPKSI